MTLGATSTIGSEPEPRDPNFERVQEAVEGFMHRRAVLKDWQGDCHQEAWICRLEYRDIETRLEEWLREEWVNYRRPSLEQLRKRGEETMGDGAGWMGELELMDQTLREQLRLGSHPADPYEIAAARIDGLCPRHGDKNVRMEFAKNRDLGFCQMCKLAYDISSDDEATPQRF